ncbi:MAG TPA: YaiI/YqxD family protein [Pseudomonadales bacterium]|nr:YaiI/YqxD family protein [Pseudomonadales bacterium]
MLQIWVDADACPNVVKEILFRVAEKRQVNLILVANRPVKTPPSKFIRTLQVESGFDIADNKIVQDAAPGDLVITADIPLASEIIAKKAHALNPRGEFYTPENIRQRLNMRDFMDTLRSSGVQSGGPPAYSQSDRNEFANQLDRFLTRYLKVVPSKINPESPDA